MLELSYFERACVKDVFAETKEAFNHYNDYEYLNADYAHFASMSLHRFKEVLKRPELTRCDLELLIRKGMASHRHGGQDEESWTSFMAHYVSRSSNENA